MGIRSPGHWAGVNIAPGAVLGDRYELGSVLGRGGTADVYAAEDRLLHRPVAVKVLRDSPDTEADRARFAAEARVLARLAHPGLVLLLDAGTEGSHPYLVLELVVGQTWGQLLGGRPADATAAAQVGVQVAAALATAHAAGVVHRDVKPGNVLVDASGRARLADFGIARLVDESLRHTRTGFTVGTAAYLAPEQVRGEEVTGATDVYALGLVLLEAVTGERAYPGTSVEAAFARLQRNPTIPVSLPRGWPRLLAAMTATVPAERPTAAEVADRLAVLADPVAEPTDPVAGVVPEDATAALDLGQRRSRRTWLPAAGVAAALGLLLTAAGLVGLTGGPDSTAAAEAKPSASASGAPSAPVSPVAAAAVATTSAEPVRAADRKPTRVAPQPKAAPKAAAAKKRAAKKAAKKAAKNAAKNAAKKQKTTKKPAKRKPGKGAKKHGR